MGVKLMKNKLPTCFPEFPVSYNRQDDQQVAQHVYCYSGDEHAGQ